MPLPVWALSCEKAGLLSPVYAFTDRGGCWFCPNAKRAELRHLYDHHVRAAPVSNRDTSAGLSWIPRASRLTASVVICVRLGGSPAAADHREVCTISKYQEFDAQIFEATKIMIGFTLSEGQKAELLKIAGEIEAACQDGSLSGDERQRLLDTMADGGRDTSHGQGP